MWSRLGSSNTTSEHLRPFLLVENSRDGKKFWLFGQDLASTQVPAKSFEASDSTGSTKHTHCFSQQQADWLRLRATHQDESLHPRSGSFRPGFLWDHVLSFGLCGREDTDLFLVGTFLTSFARSWCPAQLTARQNVCERERDVAVLRSCPTFTWAQRGRGAAGIARAFPRTFPVLLACTRANWRRDGTQLAEDSFSSICLWNDQARTEPCAKCPRDKVANEVNTQACNVLCP